MVKAKPVNFITKSQLEQVYLIEKKSARAVAEQFGCDHKFILKQLKKNDIKARQYKGTDPYVIIGQRFGDLVVESFSHKQKIARFVWNCKCDCGNTCKVRTEYLKNNVKKDCGVCKKIVIVKNAVGELSGSYWNRINTSAKVRNMEVLLTQKEAWELFLKQGRKCALTDLTLVIKNKDKTASLDRIDSSKGYTLDNVQWVHKDINFMKQNFNEEYFKYLCNLVLNKEDLKHYQG